jgi:hypothetical protein
MKLFHFAGALALLAALVSQAHAQSDNTRHRVGSEPPPGATLSGRVGMIGALDSDVAYATYRRVVQGDTSVELPRAAARAAVSQPVPGPYARYLMNSGWPRELALDQALRAGEAASVHEASPSAAPVELSAYELYQRSVLGWSLESILRDRLANATLPAPSKVSGDSQ